MQAKKALIKHRAVLAKLLVVIFPVSPAPRHLHQMEKEEEN